MYPRLAPLAVIALSAPALAGGLPDLWGHWPLDETGGVLAIDAARGYYGEYLGSPVLGLPGSVDPCHNTGVGFDGADDRVLMAGSSDALNMGTDSLSVVVRFRKTSGSARAMKLINKGCTVAGTPSNAGYALRIRDGVIEFHFSDSGPFTSVATDEPAVGAWHFVAGVLDRDGGEARLYLDPTDKSPAATEPIAGLGALDTNIEFAIAALDRTPAGSPSEHFEGEIDDVKIYRGALTGEQVLGLYEDQPCQADLAAPFGLLDLADVLGFIDAFLDGDDAADLAAPCGVLDLEDANAFVTVFVGGCG